MEAPSGLPVYKVRPVAAGWPPCLCIAAAVALLVKDADKLTLGQTLTIATCSALEGIPKQLPAQGLSSALMTHYQALFLNPARIIF